MKPRALPAAPQTKVRAVKDLGPADVDVLALEAKSLFAVEHLLEKVPRRSHIPQP